MKTKILQSKILLTILVICVFMLGFAGIGATTVYAADTCTHPSVDATGACTECQTEMVASVTIDTTTTYHADLIEAFTAANGNTATINMLANYTLPINTSGSAYAISLTSGTVTWNLNGFEVFFSSSSATTLIRISDGASLTVNAENTVWGDESSISNAGTLFSVMGDTYKVSYLSINGGVFDYGNKIFHVVFTQYRGTVNINGSTMKAQNTLRLENGTTVLENVTVKHKSDYGIWVTNNAVLSIKGGTFSHIRINTSTFSNSHYNGDFFAAFAKGTMVLKSDNTIATTSDITQASDGYGQHGYIENITVTACTHASFGTIQKSNGNGTHSTACANCEEIIDSVATACSGGAATCQSQAICASCNTAYGELDVTRHTSLTYDYISNKDGTHNKYASCCNALVTQNYPCSYFQSSACGTCGGYNISQALASAEEALSASINQKIQAVNSRTDIDNTMKSELVSSYNTLLTWVKEALYGASTTNESVESIKTLLLSYIDMSEDLNDFGVVYSLRYRAGELSETDRLFLANRFFDAVSDIPSVIFEGVSTDLVQNVLDAALDYGNDCIDMLATINSLSGISGYADEVKEGIFGDGYHAIINNVQAIYGGGIKGNLEANKALAFGMNDYWLDVAARINKKFSNTEVYEAIIGTNLTFINVVEEYISNNYSTMNTGNVNDLLAQGLSAIKIAMNIPITEATFPDKKFRDWILAQDYGKDGVLTEDEIAAVKKIDVSNQGIASLTGIEHFIELEELICHSNQLTVLDVSKNTALKTLNCAMNQLQTLDVSKNTALTTLNCNNNILQALDISKNTALVNLYCSTNELQTLDVSKNLALKELACKSNQLTSLDVSNNTLLTSLNCSDNNLVSLNLSANSSIQVSHYNSSGQTASITVISDLLLFYMPSLDSSFDSSKATITTEGAYFDGKLLVLTEKLQTVTYTYATGQNVPSMTVTLSITYSEQTSAREVEFRKNDTHIQWRYVGEADTAWRNLVALSEITGAAGTNGTNGTNGTPGADGDDGREIELQIAADGKTLQWRYVGDTDWANLFDLSTLKGADGSNGTNGTNGDEIELRKSETHIEWKYKTEADTAWRELVSLDSIKGDKGDKGEDGREVEFRKTETHIQWKYTTEADTAWQNLVALADITGADGLNGSNGTNGREIELQIATDGKTLQWRYENGTWANLFDLSVLKGADGTNGTNGTNGREVELQKNGNNIQWRYKGEDDTAWKTLFSLDDIKGEDGVGIESIVKTSTNGLVDTYTITFTDKTTTTFTVTNGADGAQGIQGIQGVPGKDGHTPVITIENGYWYIDGVNTNQPAQGVQGDKGDKGDKGDTGAAGKDGIDGTNGTDGTDGENGLAPHIGENGNWWIGDSDTGVKASGEDGVDGVTVAAITVGSLALLGNLGWGVFFIGKKKKWF